MAQLEETEPAHPKSYFEIPSDVNEPTESSTTNPQPQPHAQTSHRPSNGPWFTLMVPHPNGEKESKKCQHGLISR